MKPNLDIFPIGGKILIYIYILASKFFLGKLLPKFYLIFELAPFTLEKRRKKVDEIAKIISKKYEIHQYLDKVYYV